MSLPHQTTENNSTETAAAVDRLLTVPTSVLAAVISPTRLATARALMARIQPDAPPTDQARVLRREAEIAALERALLDAWAGGDESALWRPTAANRWAWRDTLTVYACITLLALVTGWLIVVVGR